MSELNIELIAVGDEILLGSTLDTNSHWIAGRLAEDGFHIRWLSVVSDDASDLKHQLKRAWFRADVIIMTGGLGPTNDDITKPVITRFFNDELLYRADLDKAIKDRFTACGNEPPPGYEVMAEFPSQADPIPNQNGSAAGIHYSEQAKHLFSMPGVPKEMKGMFLDYVLPKIREMRKDLFGFRIIKTAGIGESKLSELIGDETALQPVHLAYLPSIEAGVTLRTNVSDSDGKRLDGELNRVEAHIRSRAGDYIYANCETTIEEVILDLMRKSGLKLALAESCTGGLVAQRFVSIPGSSDVLDRGFVTYSNQSKMDLLGVRADTLDRFGAVSEETAREMAMGALEKAGVDIALSVTGIAGPTGGTEDKPVGLVYIGYADKNGAHVQKYIFNGDRDTNRQRSAQAALVLLWNKLKA